MALYSVNKERHKFLIEVSEGNETILEVMSEKEHLKSWEGQRLPQIMYNHKEYKFTKLNRLHGDL
jgi:hypothetical protein